MFSQSLKEAALNFIAEAPPAIQGQEGSKALFAVARRLVWDLNIPIDEAVSLILSHYNQRCIPIWSEQDIQRKCEDAAKPHPSRRPRGYLLDKLGDVDLSMKSIQPQTIAAPLPLKPAKGRRPESNYLYLSEDDALMVCRQETQWPGLSVQRNMFRFEGDYFKLDSWNRHEAENILYFYNDENHENYHVIQRIKKRNGEKKFFPFHWNPNELRYEPGYGILPRIPFFASSVKNAQLVFLVEGEKCAVELCRYLRERDALTPDVAVTCIPGGSRGWKSELVKWFVGKDVYIFPDNDAAGYDFVRRTREILDMAAKSIYCANWPDGTPKKWDIDDQIRKIQDWRQSHGK